MGYVISFLTYNIPIYLRYGYLVVMAGVPSLMPEGLRADLSPGTVFLLHEMLINSSNNSPLAPLRPPGMFFRSTCTRWQSVPPVTTL